MIVSATHARVPGGRAPVDVWLIRAMLLTIALAAPCHLAVAQEQTDTSAKPGAESMASTQPTRRRLGRRPNVAE